MIKLELEPSDAQLRQFGWISLVGFPLVGVALTVWPVGKLPIEFLWAMLGLGALMGACAALNLLSAIRPAFLVMMVLGWVIGLVIAPILIGIVYYLLFTPVGLLFRLLGRDPLQRKIDPEATSYWVARETPRTPASYLRLY